MSLLPLQGWSFLLLWARLQFLILDRFLRVLLLGLSPPFFTLTFGDVSFSMPSLLSLSPQLSLKLFLRLFTLVILIFGRASCVSACLSRQVLRSFLFHIFLLFCVNHILVYRLAFLSIRMVGHILGNGDLDIHGIVHLVEVTEEVKRTVGLAFSDFGLSFTISNFAAIRLCESPCVVIGLLLGKSGAVESQEGQVRDFRKITGVRED